MREQGQRLGFWSALALGMLAGLLWQMYVHPGATWVWVAFVLVFLSLAGWEVYSLRLGYYLRWLTRAEGDYVLALSTEGFSLQAPNRRVAAYAWSELAALETTPDSLVFYLRAGAAFAVPRAALGENGSQALTARARTLWAAAPENMGQALPPMPAAPESPSRQAWVNLREAARLAFLAPFHLRAFRPGYGALAIHLAAFTFMLGAISYLQALPIPLFNIAGIGAFGAPLLLIFVWAAAVGWILPRRGNVLRLLVITVAVLLFISMGIFLSYQVWLRQLTASSRLMDVWHAAIALWILVALSRAVRALYGGSRAVALALAGAYVVLAVALPAAAPQGSLYLDAASIRPVYVSPPNEADGAVPGAAPPAAPPAAAPGDKDGGYLDDDEGETVRSPGDALDVENTYYRQPELVRKSLAGIRPHQPGETGLYFVGFAGDGSEHEFFNEVRYARKLLERRFNTAGRSVMLVNSYDTVDSLPLANTHNMEAVLKGLAQRMDKQHDVLFLFLSSHGAQDHWLEVNLEPLDMDDLKAETLKALLDKSGIRNRVIVVSACYSGGFLDVLKDDNTLILTASSRDRVAYGCGDATEYTYFGQAYFINALTRGNSFIDAFDEARARIAAREKSEDMDPSDPQISVGHNIGAVLRELKVLPAASPGAKADAHRPAQPAGCAANCSGQGG